MKDETRVLGKHYVGNREINLILNNDGLIEGWYGKGKLTEYENKVRKWSGGVERIVTPCKKEGAAMEFIREVLRTKKPRIKEAPLPEIIFPE